MLSERRNMNAAKRFFKGALEVADQAPERVTTDGHDAYPRAIREDTVLSSGGKCHRAVVAVLRRLVLQVWR